MKRAGFIAFAVVASSIVFPSYASASTVYTFTNAGATGNTGPTQAQVNAVYSGTTLAGAVTINDQGLQRWVVPATGNYRIRAAGAAGSRATGYATTGYGAIIQGEFSLTQGQLLIIVVGQQGIPRNSSDYGGGGGGGSFVVRDGLLILAAGGGGTHGTGGGDAGSPTLVRTHADASLTETGKAGRTWQETGGVGGTAGGAGGTSPSFWNGHPGAG
jgi:hypothetical protein